VYKAEVQTSAINYFFGMLLGGLFPLLSPERLPVLLGAFAGVGFDFAILFISVIPSSRRFK
jgi:hypothetical protein